MKKVLLGTLLAGVVVLPAMAQSNVTLFGVLDVNLESINNLAGGSPGSGRTTRETSDGLYGSRWGFKGTEDLGNGYKALFTLEGGFRVDTGANSSSDKLFGRLSFVGIENKELGTVTVGRQYTAMFDIINPYFPLTRAPQYEPYAQIESIYTDNSVKYVKTTGDLKVAVHYGLGEVAGNSSAYVPAIAASIPRRYWSHTSDKIDFDALRGQRVAVIGAGASAMDNAATALERGAASVDLFVRRTDIPRINKLTGISNPGLVHGFLGLADDWKWKLQSYSISTHPPPPRDSTLRVSRHTNARFHVGSPLLSLSIDASGAVALATPKGRYQLDHIIFGTGFCQDLALRPELAALAPHIKRWQERYPAGAEQGPAELRESPDLGPIFEFQSKGAPQPGLSSIHCFNYAAMLSHGKVSGDIPAVSTGAQRLATGIAERFFQEDIALHYRDMENYDVAELQGDEWTDADA